MRVQCKVACYWLIGDTWSPNVLAGKPLRVGAIQICLPEAPPKVNGCAQPSKDVNPTRFACKALSNRNIDPGLPVASPGVSLTVSRVHEPP